MLHITNGDAVLEVMRATQLPGEYLSWLDVLHDGPVPSQPPDELARTRAQFIASLAWVSYEEALRRANERDATLSEHAGDEEIILWFEHDLFDQLQLIQILDRFAQLAPKARLSMINIGSFPGVPDFAGLGQLNPQQLASLFPERKPITAAQLDLGRNAWEAFTAPEPQRLWTLANGDTSALPYLRAALFRWFEEFPSIHNGLSRTEEQILHAAADGARDRRDIYVKSRVSEPAIFMGDASVYWRIDRLANPPSAALTKNAEGFEVTDFGRALVERRVDWIRDRGGIDTWLGGTHLSGPDAQWRWDGKTLNKV